MSSFAESEDSSPDRKKTKGTPPTVDSGCEAVSDDELIKDEDFQGGIAYPSKGPNHTIEHVYSLHNNTLLRSVHWAECVLKSSSSKPYNRLPSDLAEAELMDCLKTVSLGWAGKEWGTSMTEDQLEALKQGQSAQVMDEVYRWELLSEENELDSVLMTDLPKGGFLEKIYQVPGYLKEARSRLRAVNYVTSRIPEEEQRRLKKEDHIFRLLELKLKEAADDPRPELVSRVAMYHWFFKTNLLIPIGLPLV